VLTTANAFVEDFEEPTIALGWSAFSDVPGNQNSAQMTIQPGGAAGTGHSGHYAGTGACTPTSAMACDPNGGYGAGTTFNVAINTAIGQYCDDVCAFDGISFWAKADGPVPSPNPNNLTNTITMNFILPNTMAQYCNNTSMMPTNGTCPPLADGGAGFMSGGDCSKGCFNHPRFSIELTTEWKQYTVPFAMASGGSAAVKGLIQELGWLTSSTSTTSESWAFSIDEIAFYSGTAPTGAVNPNPTTTSDGGSSSSSSSSSGGDAATTGDATTDH
jgi:hypothetical protein